MIRHLLLIRFKPSAAPSEIQEVRRLFEAMPAAIDGVSEVEWGENDSPEGLNKGYTHAVQMSFADEATRRRYLPHPEHEALKEVFVPLVEDIVVFDYSL